MAFNFSWILDGRLAAMGQPGSCLELAGEMLPHERRFLSWLQTSSTLSVDRETLASRIGLPAALQRDRRLMEMYRKFRDIWGVLEAYREGFGENGEPVDRFALSGDPLRRDLEMLRGEGIDTIVSLTEHPLDEDAVFAAGFDEALHLPIQDRRAPAAEQVERFVGFLDERLVGGHGVVVHCLGGYGRTGTMLACYLVHCGGTAERAIEAIRGSRPGSIESGEQETAVFEYEERRR